MDLRYRRSLPALLAGLASTFAAALPLTAQHRTDVDPAAVDQVFAAFDNTRSPGCAVGVSRAGQPVLARAYGMADLEHDIPNTAETVFEPGSVSKQITAAATVLLALDGKISLDDDIRTYFPELPDYGESVTIRHLLNHTSGLRDWGSVAGIEGWPRTRRAHTHTHVLDILSRQKSLNYAPGAYYSYTNSGYNLQAMLVERVSGMPFARFSQERIFQPMGMTRTEWRDDFTRVVKDRSVAYRPNDEGGWAMLMPFEDVHGNGGLLTTVEDLLRFTQNLETGAVGGPRFVEEMHHRGVLTSGQVFFYASGIQVRPYKGVRKVEHSGSTAGYRGHLARFPDQGVAIAVMCNTTTGSAGALLHQVADLYLGDALVEGPTRPSGAIALSADRLTAFAGTYRDTRSPAVVRIRVADGGLSVQGAGTLYPVSQTRFQSSNGETTLTFEAPGGAQGRAAAVLDAPGSPAVRIEPMASFDPARGELAAYAGTYRSDEAEATYTVEVEAGSLVLKDRWGESVSMSPAYPDAFEMRGRTLLFERDASGRITTMRWSEGRVWDLHFRRIGN